MYFEKINNKNQDVINKLYQFENEVEKDDITNREGLAAKMYFRELFGDNFIRFDDDVVNAGLNYGYSIFRSLISSIIVAKGYLPNLGIFHRGKQNNMMEDILFKQEHKEALIRLTTKKLEIDGRKQTVNNAIYVYLESIIKELETGQNIYLFPKPILYDL